MPDCAFDSIAFDPVAFETCIQVALIPDVCTEEWNLNNDVLLGPFPIEIGADAQTGGCAGETSLNSPVKKVISW